MSTHKLINKIRDTLIVLIAVFAIDSPGWAATTYYIDPSGSDTTGNGLAGNPWKLLSHACTHVTTSGNTIHINAGTYTDNSPCTLAVGVNIEGAGKDYVTINSTYNDVYLQVDSTPLVNGNQTISGFTLDGQTHQLAYGISISGRNNVTLTNCNLQHINNRGIRVIGYFTWTGVDQNSPPVPPPGYATGCTLSNLTVTDCSLPYAVGATNASIMLGCVDTLTINNVTIDESTRGGCGIRAAPGWVNNSIIENCTITVDSSHAYPMPLEIYNFEKDSEVYNCTFNGGFISLNSGRKNGGTYSLKFHNNILNHPTDITPFNGHELSIDDLDFYNNYIIGNGVFIYSTGFFYNADGLSNIRIRNNIFHNIYDYGISITNAAHAYDLSNIKIYNNDIDMIRPDHAWSGFSGIIVEGNLVGNYIDGLEIKNNVITNQTYSGVYFWGNNVANIRNPVVTYNDFYNCAMGSINDAGVTNPTFSNNLAANPQFIATGDRSTQYYKLLSTSPLIDAGTNVGLPYNGVAPDIGALESVLGTPPLPPTGFRKLQ